MNQLLIQGGVVLLVGKDPTKQVTKSCLKDNSLLSESKEMILIPIFEELVKRGCAFPQLASKGTYESRGRWTGDVS